MLGQCDDGQTAVPELKSPLGIASYDRHTCAIDTEGAKCWGPSVAHLELVPFVFQHPKQIVTGQSHACVLDDLGVKCWGYDIFGQSTVPQAF